MWSDILKLRAAGYKVVEQSLWHYEVMGEHIVNIWPSKRKYMIKYGAGASFYTDVVAAVAEILGKPGAKRDKRALVKRLNAEYEASLTPEQKAAIYNHEVDMAYIGRRVAACG